MRQKKSRLIVRKAWKGVEQGLVKIFLKAGQISLKAKLKVLRSFK